MTFWYPRVRRCFYRLPIAFDKEGSIWPLASQFGSGSIGALLVLLLIARDFKGCGSDRGGKVADMSA
jgi:hypothetical protein